MKKIWLLKILGSCLCIYVTIFLFTVHSNGQQVYNPYNQQPYNLHEYPFSDYYISFPYTSDWIVTDPWKAYNLNPNSNGSEAASYRLDTWVYSNLLYFQQPSYNIYNLNMPNTYGWNQANNYGCNMPYINLWNQYTTFKNSNNQSNDQGSEEIENTTEEDIFPIRTSIEDYICRNFVWYDGDCAICDAKRIITEDDNGEIFTFHIGDEFAVRLYADTWEGAVWSSYKECWLENEEVKLENGYGFEKVGLTFTYEEGATLKGMNYLYFQYKAINPGENELIFNCYVAGKFGQYQWRTDLNDIRDTFKIAIRIID